MSQSILISTGKLKEDTLMNQVAVVTGAGTGIGFEAARALVWLGAQVILAEIDKRVGLNAVSLISTEMGIYKACFIQTDVADEKSVENLARKVFKDFGRADIIINNAAVEPIGAVEDTPIRFWDKSYRLICGAQFC